MELSDFVTAIQALSDTGMRRVAAELDSRSASAADEVSWWRAHITIDRAIRDRRCSRSASLAALSASQAVVAVAEAADVMLPDPDITAVARAAADVARAIVAGPVAYGALDYLLAAWRPIVTLPPHPTPSRLPVPYALEAPLVAFG